MLNVGNGWVAGSCWDDYYYSDYGSFPHSLLRTSYLFCHIFAHVQPSGNAKRLEGSGTTWAPGIHLTVSLDRQVRRHQSQDECEDRQRRIWLGYILRTKRHGPACLISNFMPVINICKSWPTKDDFCTCQVPKRCEFTLKLRQPPKCSVFPNC